MDYWIIINVKVQKINGTTLSKDSFILSYSNGVKEVVKEFKKKITALFKAAWKTCKEADLDDQAKRRLASKEQTPNPMASEDVKFETKD